MAEAYTKVPIYPTVKFLTSDERKKIPAPMKPISFMYGEDEINVDIVLLCDRGVSRKVGGRGFRYECRVSWCSDDNWHMQESVIWYDDFLQEWFVEVERSKAPSGWHEAMRLGDVENVLENY